MGCDIPAALACISHDLLPAGRPLHLARIQADVAPTWTPCSTHRRSVRGNHLIQPTSV